MSETIRIGTRGSQLALWQANEVSNRLRALGYRPEIVVIKTTGDKRTDTSLASIGGKGLFIKELEEALTRRAIDVAVHSLKDVPSIIPEQFVLAGFLERADPRDAWVQLDGTKIADLRNGATISRETSASVTMRSAPAISSAARIVRRPGSPGPAPTRKTFPWLT